MQDQRPDDQHQQPLSPASFTSPGSQSATNGYVGATDDRTPDLRSSRMTSSRFRASFSSPVHARERLGGYLHPRDMRRLVTPFSASNEPQLIVRRHVVLLNFDPLRAVVLRDRLLVLVPDGADSILVELERRLRGGINEMKNQVFGSKSGLEEKSTSSQADDDASDKNSLRRINSSHNVDEVGTNVDPTENGEGSEHNTGRRREGDNIEDGVDDEWNDIRSMDWAEIPFELQSLDAVLQTVTAMLKDDAREVHGRAYHVMKVLRGDDAQSSGAAPGDHAQERLRVHKDEVKIMENRVQGFVRAMNEVLDDDEDMALMNLGRLLTHPERFLQPVSQDVLHEESDEPELILEAYLQQALSIVNGLDLLKGQILTTEEQINMTLDAIRNRLLYINTLLSVASLCVSIGSFVGSIFGMNLTNHLESKPNAFVQATIGTVVGMCALWIFLSWTFVKAGTSSSFWGKKVGKQA